MIERFSQILPNPGIMARTQCFDARLLNRIEGGPGQRIGRSARGMNIVIMMPEHERGRIRKSACFGDLVRRQPARGHWYLDMAAIGDRDIGGKGELDLRIFRHRSSRAGKYRLQVIKRIGIGHLLRSIPRSR